MKRILNYTIGADAAGLTILQFLSQKHFSHKVITMLKKTENGILVDNQWSYVSRILKEHETLTLQLIENRDAALYAQAPPFPGHADARGQMPGNNLQSETSAGTDALCLPVIVVYEDEDLLVVHKPAGMPVHPSMGHHGSTLADAVFRHASQRQEQYPFRCVNRLDRDTTGLTVIAKNAYSSCILYEQMRARSIRRTYYAIAEGTTPEKGTIDAPIARRASSVIERTVDFHAGERAVTHFETLAHKNGLSFLKLALETGRTHQIRVHMNYIGHPLIGDFLYNKKDTRMKRQALHAGKLEFTHPVSTQALRFCAQLPEDMLQFFPAVIT